MAGENDQTETPEETEGTEEVTQADLRELIAEILGDNEEGATRLTEAYEMEQSANAETLSGLENRNGDAMTQLAAMEADRDALAVRIETLTSELANVKAQNWDKLMGGSVETNDDNIAETPEETDPADGDPDITPEELVNKYVK